MQVLSGDLARESGFKCAEPVCNSSALLFSPGHWSMIKKTGYQRNVLGTSVLGESMTKHFLGPIPRQESFSTASVLRYLLSWPLTQRASDVLFADRRG